MPEPEVTCREGMGAGVAEAESVLLEPTGPLRRRWEGRSWLGGWGGV